MSPRKRKDGKKLSPGQIAAIKRRAGKKSANNPENNPVRAQTFKKYTPHESRSR
jgi:hypothetical protein